jgi:hypothetical protein
MNQTKITRYDTENLSSAEGAEGAQPEAAQGWYEATVAAMIVTKAMKDRARSSSESGSIMVTSKVRWSGVSAGCLREGDKASGREEIELGG